MRRGLRWGAGAAGAAALLWTALRAVVAIWRDAAFVKDRLVDIDQAGGFQPWGQPVISFWKATLSWPWLTPILFLVSAILLSWSLWRTSPIAPPDEAILRDIESASSRAQRAASSASIGLPTDALPRAESAATDLHSTIDLVQSHFTEESRALLRRHWTLVMENVWHLTMLPGFEGSPSPQYEAIELAHRHLRRWLAEEIENSHQALVRHFADLRGRVPPRRAKPGWWRPAPSWSVTCDGDVVLLKVTNLGLPATMRARALVLRPDRRWFFRPLSHPLRWIESNAPDVRLRMGGSVTAVLVYTADCPQPNNETFRNYELRLAGADGADLTRRAAWHRDAFNRLGNPSLILSVAIQTDPAAYATRANRLRHILISVTGDLDGRLSAEVRRPG